MAKKKCWKCGGSGYLPQYKHIDNGECYPCNGTGYLGETKERDTTIEAFEKGTKRGGRTKHLLNINPKYLDKKQLDKYRTRLTTRIREMAKELGENVTVKKGRNTSTLQKIFLELYEKKYGKADGSFLKPVEEGTDKPEDKKEPPKQEEPKKEPKSEPKEEPKGEPKPQPKPEPKPLPNPAPNDGEQNFEGNRPVANRVPIPKVTEDWIESAPFMITYNDNVTTGNIKHPNTSVKIKDEYIQPSLDFAKQDISQFTDSQLKRYRTDLRKIAGVLALDVPRVIDTTILRGAVVKELEAIKRGGRKSDTPTLPLGNKPVVNTEPKKEEPKNEPSTGEPNKVKKPTYASLRNNSPIRSYKNDVVTKSSHPKLKGATIKHPDHSFSLSEDDISKIRKFVNQSTKDFAPSDLVIHTHEMKEIAEDLGLELPARIDDDTLRLALGKELRVIKSGGRTPENTDSPLTRYINAMGVQLEEKDGKYYNKEGYRIIKPISDIVRANKFSAKKYGEPKLPKIKETGKEQLYNLYPKRHVDEAYKMIDDIVGRTNKHFGGLISNIGLDSFVTTGTDDEITLGAFAHRIGRLKLNPKRIITSLQRWEKDPSLRKFEQPMLENSVIGTLVHEMGHAYHYQVMSEFDEDVYWNNFKNVKSEHDKLVSEYDKIFSTLEPPFNNKNLTVQVADMLYGRRKRRSDGSQEPLPKPIVNSLKDYGFDTYPKINKALTKQVPAVYALTEPAEFLAVGIESLATRGDFEKISPQFHNYIVSTFGEVIDVETIKKAFNNGFK